jgi:uncharacterized membrane protein
MSKTLAVASLSTLVVLVVLDFLWLSNALNFLYRPKIGPLLAEKPQMGAAAVFYILYAVGLSVLVLRPALASGGPVTALWTGALFGLVAYGTYNLTNQATLKGWSPVVTVVDMGWGAAVTAVAAAAGVWIGQRFG